MEWLLARGALLSPGFAFFFMMVVDDLVTRIIGQPKTVHDSWVSGIIILGIVYFFAFVWDIIAICVCSRWDIYSKDTKYSWIGISFLGISMVCMIFALNLGAFL